MLSPRRCLILAALLWGGFAFGPCETFSALRAQTTLEVLEQTAREYREADLALNKTYQALSATQRPAARKRLVKAQLAWISFRDAECAFEEDQFRGGSHRPVAGQLCLKRLTQQRVQELAAVKVGSGPGAASDSSRLKEGAALYAQADQRLNAAYRALVATLDAEGKRLLTQAELKWLAFRDADADFRGDGKTDAYERLRRLRELTEVRANDLLELGRGIGSR